MRRTPEYIIRNLPNSPKMCIEALEKHGYKIVPVEPTPEMIRAGWAAVNIGPDSADEVPTAYKAMLKAAP